jgi:penicillin-binding protein A
MRVLLKRLLVPGILLSFGAVTGSLAETPSPVLALPAASKAKVVEPVKPTRFGDADLVGLLNIEGRKLVKGRFEVPLSDGRRAVLTLDPALQAKAEAVLKEAKAPYASIVVLSVDGRVLAMAGASRREPNLTAASLATRPWAPSASVFKIVTSAALLDAGVRPDTKVCYHGGTSSVEPDNLVDNKRDRDCASLAYGVARSQNAIMAKLAVRHLSPKTLLGYAERFGYNQAPLFAVAAQPSTAKMPEDKLEFARAAAGFWHSELSPLGGALVANTVASGGLSVTPRIVAAIIDKDGVEHAVMAAAPRRVLERDTARSVARMMTGTTEFGTASSAFQGRRGPLLSETVAGKTGSLTEKGRKDPVHYSWFVGFAPADAPELVVSVLLGNSEDWQLKGSQAARMVLDTRF